jgi:N-formylglutamate deformylase
MSAAPALWRIERPASDSAKRAPLIVNVPHAGTYLPPSIAQKLTAAGIAVPDTDWHVDKLYDFVPAMGATLMVATHSRIAVDLNRDPSGAALYPGASNTEICPTQTFAEVPIYQQAMEPDRAEIASRVAQYWQPYHRQLVAEIARVKAMHGYCILLDAHSIVSVAPRFFSGRLPDLNLGSADGKSCARSLADAAFRVLSDADGFSAVHNGRFKGGYITRHYGDPGRNVHALQLEMAQCCYMDEAAPLQYDAWRAAKLRAVLKTLIELLMNWHPAVGDETKKWEHS